MSIAVFREDEAGSKIWASGSVIIDHVEHRVAGGVIACNSSLNSKAWNVTEGKTVCRKCFRKYVQAELFEPVLEESNF